MSKLKRLDATLRRWQAVNLCLDRLGYHGTVLRERLAGDSIPDVAKRHRVTRERVRQIEEKARQILADMLFDEE